MHQSSLDKMSAFREEYLKGLENEELKILDFGSYDVNGSYKRFFNSPKWRYIGADMTPGNNVDLVLSDPYNWHEIGSSSIDVIISGQTFENMEFFWLTMLEIARVLKPGGLCCIIAPSGGFEHRYPVDCWRFYPDGFSALARFVKFEVLKAETQWEPKGYKDDSDKWKDTVLVCRKPKDYNPETPEKIKRSFDIAPAAEKGVQLKPCAFNPMEYSAALFQEPRKLSDVTSWHEHIPFAYTLMQMLKPKVFVELGTHKGDSYLAFCQAVSNLALDTRCYAVDTWKGEEHAGRYSDDVYQELKSYHDPLYSGFSSLLRCTFDEALGKFADGTVDLLHIDGLHTYEAVKHDFETWLPKMNQSGVILFHDIAVRERDFGVWKLWEELKGKYPNFEFRHCNGLGVLATGKIIPEQLSGLFSANEEEAAKIGKFYHLMGSHAIMPSLSKIREAQIAEMQKQLNEQARYIDSLLNSQSWKITAPLRKILGFVKKG